jgi:NitT/TauT family transport system substrate-binding protein
MKLKLFAAASSLIAALIALPVAGWAEQKPMTDIKVAASHRGIWDSTMIEFGVRKGWFKQQGLNVDVLWNNGGGADTLQSVAVGSAQIGFGNGLLGVLSAWAKDAPIDVISAEATGAPDMVWYVKGNSPLKSIKDLNGKTVAFTRPGASSQFVLRRIVSAHDVSAKLISGGALPAQLTAVMSGQIDVGFTVMPIGINLIQKGDLRVLFNGQEAPGVKDQTVRVHYANAEWLKTHTDAARRFMVALHKTIEWAYSADEALQMWADINKITLGQARAARDSSYPKSMLALHPIQGLDRTINEAVESKRLAKPLTSEQKKKLLEWSDRLNPL